MACHISQHVTFRYLPHRLHTWRLSMHAARVTMAPTFAAGLPHADSCIGPHLRPVMSLRWMLAHFPIRTFTRPQPSSLFTHGPSPKHDRGSWTQRSFSCTHLGHGIDECWVGTHSTHARARAHTHTHTHTHTHVEVSTVPVPSSIHDVEPIDPATWERSGQGGAPLLLYVFHLALAY